jgi:hypothetical protein
MRGARGSGMARSAASSNFRGGARRARLSKGLSRRRHSATMGCDRDADRVRNAGGLDPYRPLSGVIGPIVDSPNGPAWRLTRPTALTE